jgi:hypothetical protein
MLKLVIKQTIHVLAELPKWRDNLNILQVPVVVRIAVSRVPSPRGGALFISLLVFLVYWCMQREDVGRGEEKKEVQMGDNNDEPIVIYGNPASQPSRAIMWCAGDSRFPHSSLPPR